MLGENVQIHFYAFVGIEADVIAIILRFVDIFIK